jgi:O-antigen/teichoic acid export membrane protein
MLKHRRNRRIVVSAGVGGLQRLVQVASTLLLMPVMLHALGPGRFGVWGAAASLAWLSGLVDIGTGSALVTLVARALAHEQEDEARRHIAGALTLGVSLAGPVLLLAGSAYLWGGWRGDAAVYLIAFAGLGLNLPLNSANNIWMALQEGYYSSTWELVQTVVTTAVLMTATVYTQDVRVYVAVVYGGLVASNLGSLIHLFVRHPNLRPKRLPAQWVAMREVAFSGMMFFLMGIAGSLTFMLDNVLALQLLGPEASAQMTIALRICMTAVGLLAVVSQPLWPAFTDAAHKSDHQWILRNLVRGVLLLTGVAAVGSAILLLWGEQLLRLWLHANLGIGRGLLWAISAWIVAQALFRVPGLLLNGMLMIRFQTIVFVLATATAFGLKFALAGRLGVGGILWGTSLTVLLIVLPSSLWRILRWARDSKFDGAQGRRLVEEDATRYS